MAEWTFNDLEKFDSRICDIAKDYNLDWFPIMYETCDYYEMIGHMAYHGMPSHYGHWSYGKSFEQTHQRYNLGMEGLPYELIINSDPSIAYLMIENPLYLQVLIMAHCVGHSDFFKNNKEFIDTEPERIISSFRNARNRIQGYIEDPSIGINKVEKIIDAAQALQFHINRNTRNYKTEKAKHTIALNDYNKNKIINPDTAVYPDFSKKPFNPEYDLFGFILENCNKLEEWEFDVLEISRNEAYYFLPQMQTKVMNEGWASFWHYRLTHDLVLPDSLHLPFLKSHNQVIRPHPGRVNPYYVGFVMFQDIEERFGLDECFHARETCNDESFFRTYLTRELCEKLGLFEFVDNKEHYLVTDVSDNDGWKNIRSSLIKQTGLNNIPMIYIEDITSGEMILHHEHDGRDIELNYAEHVIKHIKDIWKDDVKLITTIEDEPFEI
jgi:stage V sporulation protein R